MRTQRAAAALLSLVLCAACGSTVQVRSSAALGAGGEGLTAPVSTAATTSPVTLAGSSGDVRAPQGSATSTSTTQSTQPVATSSVLGSTGPGAARGLGKLEVGFEYVDGGGGAAAATAIGVDGVSPGDQRAEFQVLVDDVNRHGGVAGHQLQAVYFAYDATGSSLSTQEQAMCSLFTQDHKVFAALVLSISTEVALNCLQKSGALTEAQGLGANVDDEVFRRYNHYLTAGSLNLSRLPRAWVAGLDRQQFFTKGSKTGVVTVDDASFVRTAKVALPAAMKAAGHRLEETYVVPTPRTVGDLGATAPAVQSAVLRFRSAGVTRVLFLEPVGGIAQLFMQVSESQGYHPRYGLTTDDELSKLVTVAAPAQLAGSVGIGWFPLYEVSRASQGLFPEGKRCLTLMTTHRITFDDDNARSIALAICDEVTTLVALVTHAGTTRVAALAQAVSTLGVVPSAAHPHVSFDGRRDGITAVRDLAFSAPCTCFRYISGPVPS